MRRWGPGEGVVPPELVHFREADWVGDPDGGEGSPVVRWHAARRAWMRENPPRDRVDLVRLYGPGVVFPPGADPGSWLRIDSRLVAFEVPDEVVEELRAELIAARAEAGS